MIEASALLFSKDAVELLINASADLIAQLPMISAKLDDNTLLELLTSCTDNIIFSSNGEARKAIQGNAVSVNKIKVTDPNKKLDKNDLIKNRYILIGNGKQKNYILAFN